MRLSKKAVEELSALETRSGKLRPAAVVAAARDGDSALHRYFEWDDEKAAVKYRLATARDIIRLVKVKVINNKTFVLSPKYVSDPERVSESVYVVLTKAKEYSAKQIMLSELSALMADIDRVIAIATVRKMGLVTTALRKIRDYIEKIATKI